jgi:hypothetical protein
LLAERPAAIKLFRGRFQHHLIDNFQDDALDVSTEVPTLKTDAQVYQNLVRASTM